MTTDIELDATTGAHAPTLRGETVEPSGREEQATSAITSRRPVEASPRPVLSFAIPDADREFFCKRLGLKVQAEIKRMLRYAEIIHRGPTVEGACKRLAHQLAVTSGERDEHGALKPPRGCNWRSLQKKYYAYANGCTRTEAGREVEYAEGDWRVFWDKAKWPMIKAGEVARRAQGSPNDPAFVEFLRANHENNQRGKFARFYDELIHVVTTRHALNDLEVGSKVIKAGYKVPFIPGYPEWPALNPATGVPFGWTLSNLQRKCCPDDFEIAAATIGTQAASHYGAKVHLTRVGLRIGEFIEFDDHDFNVQIAQEKQKKILRPSGFFAMDVLTAHMFAHGIKPTQWDLDEEKKRTLTEDDFKYFLIYTLTTHGRRTDERGTTCILENAKATIRRTEANREFIEGLERMGVRLEFAGRHSKGAHVGQPDPAKPGHGRGNFRFKALLEGWFQFLDNACASFPGQMGKDRDHAPEQIAMREAGTRALLTVAGQLPPERAALLQYPVLFWEEFFWRVQEQIQLIENRTRHEIEGWEKLRFMSEALRNNAGEIVVAPQRFSPCQAYTALRHELKPLPRFEWPSLLGPANCYRANGEDTVLVQRDNAIWIDSFAATGDTDVVRFDAVDYHGRRLKIGSRWRAYLNRYDLRAIILTDEHNRAVAECPRINTPCRNDLDGLNRELGRVGKWKANALEGMNLRHIASGRALAEADENNANAITGRNLRLEEKEQAAQERATTRRLDAEPDDIGAFAAPEGGNEKAEGRSEAAGGGDDQMSAFKEFDP